MLPLQISIHTSCPELSTSFLPVRVQTLVRRQCIASPWSFRTGTLLICLLRTHQVLALHQPQTRVSRYSFLLHQHIRPLWVDWSCVDWSCARLLLVLLSFSDRVLHRRSSDMVYACTSLDHHHLLPVGTPHVC